MEPPTYSLAISPDLFQVRLHSLDTDGEAVALRSGSELRDLLAARGIVFGLNEESLALACAIIDQGEALPDPLLLAQGTHPVPGRRDLQLIFPLQSLAIETVDDEGNPRETEIQLAPLVLNGGVIAEYMPPVEPVSGRNVLGQEVACPSPTIQVVSPGEHVSLIERTQQIVALASGYPVIERTTKGLVEQLTVSIERLITVTPDKMLALLHLKPPPTGQALPALVTIEQVMEEERVVSGRRPEAIAECLARCAAELLPQQAVVALGTLPVNGTDAWLRFEMDVGALPGRELEDGSIDFRDRNMFVGVDKDQLIAVRVPATPGTPGQDVFGEQTMPQAGRDLVVKVADDASYDQVSGEIRASRAGVLSVVSEHSIKVCALQVISGDVGFETGNVISRNALEIKGSVQPKFKVNALGDILIRGNIEKAQVRSDSSVVVQAGMLGDFAVIRARGDVDIQFIENGRIIAGGNILLRKNAYYCRLHAGGDLQCDPSSRVITSQMVAGGSITAGIIGSDNAEPCLVAAAVNPQQLHQMYELRRVREVQSAAVEALQRKIGPLGESDEMEELVETLYATERQLAELNLITPKDQEPADCGLAHAQGCTIVVKGKIFAGAEIRIGNSRMVLDMTMSSVCFRLRDHAEGGNPTGPGIVFGPAKK